jgi:nicotinate-nucleotide adenylyltransferase
VTRRVGLYAGSFAPAHQGHIAFCLAALAECHLDEVIILPESLPRGKPRVMKLEKRLDYLLKAMAPHSRIRVVEFSESFFTVETTLPKVQRLVGEAEIFLLLGSDVMKSVPAWPHVRHLVGQVSFVIGLRRNDTDKEVSATISLLEEQTDTSVSFKTINVSARFMSSSFLQKLGSIAVRM